jgi:glycosyltransferase involved in cell wall biosynthesis/peptidoglycan/xylan/chitin deacetylase (PgdA/CDA1 family)
VSVIIPVYNAESFFEKCLRSLFEQTLKNIEYIIINDCTPDASMILLDKILSEYPERKEQVRIIDHPQNLGSGMAKKDGMKAARGEYVISCDSDDWVDGNLYETMYKKAIEDDADMVCCGIYEEYIDRRIKKIYLDFEDDKKKPVMEGGILYGSLCNKLVRRSLYQEYDIYPFDGINIGEDTCTTIRLRYFSKKTVMVNDVFYHYNKQNDASLLTAPKPSWIEDRVLGAKYIEDFFRKQNAYDEFYLYMQDFKFWSKRGYLLDKSIRDIKRWRETFPETHKNIGGYTCWSWRMRLLFWLAAHGAAGPVCILLDLKSMRRNQYKQLLKIAKHNFRELRKRAAYKKGEIYKIIVYFKLSKIVYDFSDCIKNGRTFLIPFTVKNIFGKNIAHSSLEWIPENNASGILLSFDDCFEEEWQKSVDTIFDEYNAKATFFVNGMEPTKFCFAALAKGHEIASHTISHKNLKSVSRQEFDYETKDAITRFTKEGFSFSSFAYPFGSSDLWMHTVLLKYYNVVRGFATHLYLYQKEKLRAGQFIVSKSIDNLKYNSIEAYKKDIKAILLMTKFLGDGILCPLTSHTIDDNADWGIDPERLKYLLQLSSELELKFYLYKEIFIRPRRQAGTRSIYPAAIVSAHENGIYHILKKLVPRNILLYLRSKR